VVLTKIRKRLHRRHYTGRQVAARCVLGSIALTFVVLLYVLAPIALLQDPAMNVNPDLWIYYSITLGAPAIMLGLIWGLTNLD
jgi:hypothetical protein